ncbi:restriction endonuclease [Flavobacterium sp. RHBU_3]|uniref:restriction endonuclease n=1 Tax=Flavobacterium sp. RHBU_3 TaxID=3391184 RepID=UPI0039850C27
MNNWQDYERLTQEIYQGLLNDEGLTVEVKRNVKIKGKSTTHQIDIYWEYKFAGIMHKVAIECKNYNKRISKGIISSFYGTLSDIGNINGIIVTKIGFQSGAKKFADYYGINLIELREPKPEDWAGRLRVLTTNARAISTNVKKWFVQLDYQWCKSNIPENQLNAIEIVISGMNYDVWIYDSEGNKLMNFLDLQNQLPFDENKLNDNDYVHQFANGFVKSENFGYVKIKAVHMNYNSIVNKFTYERDSLEATKAILRNVSSGEIKFIK